MIMTAGKRAFIGSVIENRYVVYSFASSIPFIWANTVAPLPSGNAVTVEIQAMATGNNTFDGGYDEFILQLGL